MSYIKQILETISYKLAAVQAPTTHPKIRHCWRSKDELISDVLLWTPSHGCASVGWPARTYLQQLCTDTGCSLEDLPVVMDERQMARVREIRVSSTRWYMHIHGHLKYTSVQPKFSPKNPHFFITVVVTYKILNFLLGIQRVPIVVGYSAF